VAEDPFNGPKSLCRWAGEEIDHFETVEKAFFDEDPGSKTENLNYATGEVIHKLVFTTPLPDNLRRSAYRIVNDLRNALDQAMYSASKELGGLRLKYVAFPFGEDGRDFRKQIARTDRRAPYQDIPSKLHPLLKSFRPYHSVDGGEDGNDVLRSLARIANPNKHIVPLGICTSASARFYGARGVLISIGNRQSAENEIELYRSVFGKPLEIDYRPEPHIGLENAGPLTGQPALATFREMLTIVNGIVFGLEAEVARLLRR
jgi:hypothetical protein